MNVTAAPGSSNGRLESGPEATDAAPVLEWTVHPVTRRPWVSIGVSALVVVLVSVIRITTDSQAFAVLALVILAASLAKFYFPTKYRLDDNGVTIKTTTQTLVKEWKLYRSCYPDKNGILLSPFATTSRLENFRGLYIMFEGNGSEVTSYCLSRITAAPPEVTT